MQSQSPNKAPPPRSAVWIALVALTVVVCAVLLWLFRPAKVPASRSARAATTAPGSYRNRAVLRPASGPGAQAEDRPAVKGYVYDASGNGLAGAVVVANTFDRAGNMPSAAGSARTDAQGRFALPLARGSYQLTASLAGYGTSAASAEAGDTVSLVLHKGGVIQGKVLDDHGQPVTRFTIDVLFALPGDAPALPPAWSKTFESSDGSYRADQVPPWPVVVRAVADDWAPGLSAPQVVRPGETRDVDLAMSPGCTLSGVVQDRKGNPLGRVLVNAEERLSAGSATDPVLQTATQAQSGDDGSFTLEHVPKGKVMVRGYDGDYAVSTVTVDVGNCDKLAPVKLTMGSGGTLSGTAKQADGKPLAGALVSVVDRAVGFVNTTTDANGQFRFEALPAGDMRVELESKGQRNIRTVHVNDGETTHLEMALFGGGQGEIRGRVTAGGKPMAGARVLVAANHGEQDGLGMYFPVTGEDGTFRVSSLSEGNYLVTVIASRASTGVQVTGSDPVTVNLDAGYIEPARQRARRTPPPPQQMPPTPSP